MALVGVLVVGAIASAAAISILYIGLGSARTSFAEEQSAQARSLANACAEEALQKIRDSKAFVGSGDLSLGGGSCRYTVSALAGQARTIVASGAVGSIVRKLSVSISAINPVITVVSWREVAD